MSVSATCISRTVRQSPSAAAAGSTLLVEVAASGSSGPPASGSWWRWKCGRMADNTTACAEKTWSRSNVGCGISAMADGLSATALRRAG